MPDIHISNAALDFLARILAQPGPVMVPEGDIRDELLKVFLSSPGLSVEHEFKLSAEIQRSAQQTFPKSVSVDVIIRTVIDQFPGVTIEKLLSDNRNREVNLARHIIMLLIVKLVVPRPSYRYIAEKLGRKDHTTVISAINGMANQISQNPSVREVVERILLVLSWKYEDVFGAV